MRKVKENLTGKRSGKLSIIELSSEKISGRDMWLCQCDCGKIVKVRDYDLRKEITKSCGCLAVEKTKTHGMYKSPEYKIWGSMLSRCYNVKSSGYKNYGGRGIIICERWHNFENFYADMRKRPDKLQIDRINNDGIYEPTNCRWATQKTQLRNKRSNKKLTYKNQTMCISELVEKTGTNAARLNRRLSLGWKIEDAINLSAYEHYENGKRQQAYKNIPDELKEKSVVPKSIILARLSKGYSIEKALFEPYAPQTKTASRKISDEELNDVLISLAPPAEKRS